VLRVLAEEVAAAMREREQARLYADTGAADHAR
jgi:hypothetical protein